MGHIRSHEDLIVWQRAIDLVVACYAVSRELPNSERFGLTTQIQRAATSIPANIAEGHGRFGSGEFLHHLSIAHGSLKELETHLVIVERVGLLEAPQLREARDLADEVGRLLYKLVQRLRTPAPN